MEPGFFLDLADITGDKFSYAVLPVKDWYDIPLQQRPVNLVYSVVRSHKIDSTDEPTCCKTSDVFKVFNRHSNELFGTEEIQKLIPDSNKY